MDGLGKIPANMMEIVIKRSEKGFGIDNNHIPGHNGIFVSKIRNEGPAADDGRLNVGDRILKVNGIDLLGKTHDEVVEIFRNVDECRMLIEPDAERIILSQPSNLILPGCSSPTATTARSRHGSRSGSPRSSRTGSPARASSPTRCLRQVSTHLESPAPSVISILDDIPRTPKKPTGSVLDPSNPSVLAEVLFLSIGTVALGAGLFVVYRLLRRR